MARSNREKASKRARAKVRAKARLQKAQDKSGYSKSQIKQIMRDKNLGKRIDNKKELQRVLKVAGRRQAKAAAKDERQDANRERKQIKSMTRKAVVETGMSGDTIRGIAADLGIGKVDSANDVYRINQELTNRENERINNSPQMVAQIERFNQLKEASDRNKVTFQQVKGDLGDVRGDLKTARGDLKTARGTIDERDGTIETRDKTITGLEGKITGYETDIRGYKDDISKYDTKIEGYKTDFDELTGKYEGVIKDNEGLTTERDEANKKLEDKSALYEQLKLDADVYRRNEVDASLAGLRGGATSGGGNQTSYAGGDLASGRTGYSSSTQSRDKGLADYVMQDGGATDSVLNREGPVVETMNKGGGGGGGSPRAMRRRTNSGGTGSYYASRFGG